MKDETKFIDVCDILSKGSPARLDSSDGTTIYIDTGILILRNIETTFLVKCYCNKFEEVLFQFQTC